MANTSVSLVDLDFDTIKNNLKTYLKNSDSPFKDVDFDGSNISHLLDVLSYNTFLNNFYLNMVAGEMFLDTAQLRDSIVSHAKELNYVPKSFTSAQAVIQFVVTPNTPIGALVIPKGTSFTTKLGSNNYSFTTDESQVISANIDGKFYANLAIYEGTYSTDSFVYVESNTQQRFVISNPTVDTRSITVSVIEDGTSNVHSYTRATSFLGQSANSKIYFLQAAENSQYEVVFGDNIIGRKPKNGATIVIEYRNSNGELPNGARIFDIDGPIQGQANISPIVTVSSAAGGSINEPIEKIKYNAVRYYQNQDRAVTTTDYESILQANFPEIQAISAYGGEDASPPQYGRVFISVDIANADGVSADAKTKYYNFIKSRSPVSIEPVFIDPDFIYVEVNCNVKYNVNVTSLRESDISMLIKLAVSNYNTNNLSGFKKTLYYSRLLEAIDSSHNSIISNSTSIIPFALMTPITGKTFTKTINFGFPLARYNIISYDDYIRSNTKAIYSTQFVYKGVNCSLQDDGEGNVCIFTMTGFDANANLKKVGTVDYDTGLVTITDLIVDSYTPASGSHMHLYANPLSKDIDSAKNSIIVIRDSDVEISVTPVKL